MPFPSFHIVGSLASKLPSTESGDNRILWTPPALAWQVHLGALQALRGRCSTWEHFHRSPQKSGDNWILWVPAALGWQVQLFEHISCILQGRRSTLSTSAEFCIGSMLASCLAGAALGAPSKRSAGDRRQLSTMDVGCFYLAGAELWAHQLHFAWQAEHFEQLHFACGTY